MCCIDISNILEYPAYIGLCRASLFFKYFFGEIHKKKIIKFVILNKNNVLHSIEHGIYINTI